jgi:anti-sigma B factor antagonist
MIIMNRQGEMKVLHVNETILDIFEVTGFSDILTIE